MSDPVTTTPAPTQPINRTTLALWLLAVALTAALLQLLTMKNKLEQMGNENDKLLNEQARLQEASAKTARDANALIGTWRCQYTAAREDLRSDSVITGQMTIRLGRGASGQLTQQDGNSVTDDFEGPWRLAGQYLMIDRPDGGYASFKLVSKSDSKMTLITRAGFIMDFTKVN